MRRISAALIKYNANSRDDYVGDCVKRSISVALDMPYDEVGRRLRQIQKERGLSSWKTRIVYYKLLSQYGASPMQEVPEDERIDLGTWADAHPSGSYIVEAGGPESIKPDHLVAIIDGDIYDSWDSTKDIIYRYCQLPKSIRRDDQFDVMSIWDDVKATLEPYIAKLNSKFPNTVVELDDDVIAKDRYTLSYDAKVTCKDMPNGSGYYDGYVNYHTFIIKTSISGVDDAKLAIILKSAKQKMYDWVYNMNYEIRQYAEARSMSVNPWFRGNRLNLLKCPEWARPLIRTFKIHEPSESTSFWRQLASEETPRYEVWMESLPGDTDHLVKFECDTVKELKAEMEKYRWEFS